MENNIYWLTAMAQWRRGEDGEVIARELAKAFAAVVKEGSGADPAEELVRLLKGE